MSTRDNKISGITWATWLAYSDDARRIGFVGALVFVLLLAAVSLFGQSRTEKLGRWQVTSTPAVSTQASASKAAGGGTVKHVVDTVCFSAGSTTAPALTKLNINIRDGATGAGTIIWSYTVVVPASTGQNVAPFCAYGLNITGSANTAMTAEFSASLTNLFQDISISGYSLP